MQVSEQNLKTDQALGLFRLQKILLVLQFDSERDLRDQAKVEDSEVKHCSVLHPSPCLFPEPSLSQDS
jgi:hypothetical protein